MIQFHPDVRYLTDYTAGSLPASQALCVASHLHYCAHCRETVGSMNKIGGSLFRELEPVSVSESLFDSILENIDEKQDVNIDEDKSKQSSSEASQHNRLPTVVNNFVRGGIESLKWNRIGKGFRYSYLDMQDKQRETSLFFINAGGKIPRHDHGGDELTVVLKGSFSDQEACYRVGDFIVRSKGEKHTPVAAQDEDCLCLSTLEAPIKMTNWFYKLAVPFLKFRAETA